MALISLASLATASPAVRPEVRSVTFEGNAAFDADRLGELMVMSPPAFLSSTDFQPDAFADDLTNIENFYHQNGYLQARITGAVVRPDTAANAVDILIRLFEGDLTHVDTLSITGNALFPDSLLLAFVGLKHGDPFLARNVHDAMVAMVTLYADSGYLDAAVHPDLIVDSTMHLASIHLRVIERAQYVIRAIRITGSEKSRDEIVKRELLFEEGEVVHYSLLMESQRRLYLTGLFESVFIHPDSTGDSTRKDILVELKEKLSGEFNVAVGFGSVEKLRGKVQVMTTNFQGTGRQLGTTLSASFIKQGAEGSFTEPWTFGSRWRTDVNVLYEFQQEPSYHLRKYGARLTIGRAVGLRSNVSLTYRFENASLSKVLVPILPIDVNPHVRSLTLSVKNDERDDPFNSTHGTYAEWNNELAGAFLSGTNTFARSTIQLKWFHALSSETVIGSALDLGWMSVFGSSKEIPLSERFFAGGPNALRAFDYQKVGPQDNQKTPLGGNFKIIWNLAELRRVVYKFVGAVVFVDVGQVWGDIRDFHISDLKIAVGPGLRLNTPIGMVRLDWGINVIPQNGEGKGRLYFNMGQAF